MRFTVQYVSAKSDMRYVSLFQQMPSSFNTGVGIAREPRLALAERVWVKRPGIVGTREALQGAVFDGILGRRAIDAALGQRFLTRRTRGAGVRRGTIGRRNRH